MMEFVNFAHSFLCYVIKVPWKSLGKEPVIVLIDRIFVLAYPAEDGQTMKVHRYFIFIWLRYVYAIFWVELILLQEEDSKKLFEAKIQQIEVRLYASFYTCVLNVELV